jgi:hypothetical protein
MVFLDAQIRMGSAMMVSGPSSCGKTFFTVNFIAQSDSIFDIPPVDVYWFYGRETRLHDSLVKRGYHMIRGIPENFDFIVPNSIVVLDDMMLAAKKSEEVSNLFTQTAHHLPCFIIFIVQNLFYQSKESRNRHLNTQYNVIFRNPRDKMQIKHLQAQMYPNSGNFLVQAFDDATQDQTYSYLLIDYHSKTNDLIRVRARILPHEQMTMPQVVYVPTSQFPKTVAYRDAILNNPEVEAVREAEIGDVNRFYV